MTTICKDLFFFNYAYACLSVRGHVCTHAGIHGSRERSLDPLEPDLGPAVNGLMQVLGTELRPPQEQVLKHRGTSPVAKMILLIVQNVSAYPCPLLKYSLIPEWTRQPFHDSCCTINYFLGAFNQCESIKVSALLSSLNLSLSIQHDYLRLPFAVPIHLHVVWLLMLVGLNLSSCYLSSLVGLILNYFRLTSYFYCWLLGYFFVLSSELLFYMTSMRGSECRCVCSTAAVWRSKGTSQK